MGWASRSSRVVVALFATTLFALSARSSDSPSTEESPTSTTAGAPHVMATRLDSAIAQVMVTTSPPEAMAGIWGPDGDYVRAFGVADKVTRATMQTDFYSRIGSVAKIFT